MALKADSIALGDLVAILSHDSYGHPAKPRTATVVYAGPDYIRLSDGSVHATAGLGAIQGNANTRIELVQN